MACFTETGPEITYGTVAGPEIGYRTLAEPEIEYGTLAWRLSVPRKPFSLAKNLK